MKKGKHEVSIVRSSAAEYLTFITATGKSDVNAVYFDENVWLTQKMMGLLYNVETNTINYHLKKIFADGEIEEESVIRKFRITAADGKNYNTNHYNLSAIIAVGNKVDSPRAVQFIKWANVVVQVFEIELIRQIEINIDYILMLVKKYHDTHCEDKEVLITINKAIDVSPELRSKKQLIETFIAGINDVDDVMNEWHEYVMEQRDHDLNAIITEEKLKPEDTRKFMENAFRDGEIKTAGTDIDKLMPPISRFGGGGRAKKKQGVIDKLKTFFEKYFGIGGSSTFTEPENKTVTYDLNSQKTLSMVAESKTPYGKQS